MDSIKIKFTYIVVLCVSTIVLLIHTTYADAVELTPPLPPSVTPTILITPIPTVPITPTPTVTAATPDWGGCIYMDNLVADANAGTVTFDVRIDSPDDFDTIRMEMIFNPNELSNGTIDLGADFNNDFGEGFQDNLAVAIFGSTDSIGPSSGNMHFATITFDWTGNQTEIGFNAGNAPEESGSLVYYVGDYSSLTNECGFITGDLIGSGAPSRWSHRAITLINSADETNHTTYSIWSSPHNRYEIVAPANQEYVLQYHIPPIDGIPIQFANPEEMESIVVESNGTTIARGRPFLLSSSLPHRNIITGSDVTVPAEIDHTIELIIPPIMRCRNVIADAEAGVVSFDVIVDSPQELDTVRIEMIFDDAQLSNGVLQVGADFDSAYGKPQFPPPAGSIVDVFGRSEALGSTSGELHFATFTSDWTGNPTQIDFAPSQFPEERGALIYLMGDYASLATESCQIPASEPAQPAVTETPTVTIPPTPPTISCRNVVADAETGVVSFDVIVDSPQELDTVRMEMLFDGAELSNRLVYVGDDFDSAFGTDYGAWGGLPMNEDMRVFGRSEHIGGATNGELHFATYAFDWTGNPTQIDFNPGQAPTEAGSLTYLGGQFTNVEVESCQIGDSEYEQPAATSTPIPTPTIPPTIGCRNIVGDAARGIVSFDVIVDSPQELDQVRMELFFDMAELSNGSIELGADFDSDFGHGFQDNLGVAIFARSAELGSTSGELHLATVTFGWTGNPTQIDFNPDQSPTEAGSLIYLIGDYASLVIENCQIGGSEYEQPAATSTPIPTPITPTTVLLPATITGLVTEFGAPKVGIVVILFDVTGTVYTETVTDENGRYLFTIPAEDTEQSYELHYIIPVNSGRPANSIEGADIFNIDLGAGVTTATSNQLPLTSDDVIENDVNVVEYVAPTAVSSNTTIVQQHRALPIIAAFVSITALAIATSCKTKLVNCHQ